MPPRSRAGDEQNGSFGAAERASQDAKPGVESAARAPEADEPTEHRRRPNEGTYETRASLADRIRARETE
jgi:hypothetical protein